MKYLHKVLFTVSKIGETEEFYSWYFSFIVTIDKYNIDNEIDWYRMIVISMINYYNVIYLYNVIYTNFV